MGSLRINCEKFLRGSPDSGNDEDSYDGEDSEAAQKAVKVKTPEDLICHKMIPYQCLLRGGYNHGTG